LTSETTAIRILPQVALIDELLGAYAAVLDNNELVRWPELFTEDCAYAVYSRDNAERGLPLGYMIDDSRDRLHDRVKFITEVWTGTIEPYRSRHLIQRTKATPISEGEWRVEANFLIAYSEIDGQSALLASGYYADIVRVTPDGPLFADKKVFLDGTPSRYLVYPL